MAFNKEHPLRKYSGWLVKLILQLGGFVWRYILPPIAYQIRRRPIYSFIFLGSVYIIGVNALVQQIGRGSPPLFSTQNLPQKTYALWKLLLHMPSHLLGACSYDPHSVAAYYADKRGLPRSLVIAIIQTESSYHSHAISSSGAMGIMQLMPKTAQSLDVWDPFSMSDNIDGGTKLILEHWNRYDGDIDRILGAYHAGPRNVPKVGPMHIGPKTRRYIKVVNKRMQVLYP